MVHFPANGVHALSSSSPSSPPPSSSSSSLPAFGKTTTTAAAAAAKKATSSASHNPRVAIIGAGAAGLAAARSILKQGEEVKGTMQSRIEPFIFEQDMDAGGVWRYDDPSKKDSIKDRPMYNGLRTNLPKELMAFREFPFHTSYDDCDLDNNRNDDKDDDDGDDDILLPKDSFITHRQVQNYLVRYKHHFHLDPYIQYGCQVQSVKVLNSATKASKLSPSPSSSLKESEKKEHHEIWPQIRLTWTQQTTTSHTDENNENSEKEKDDIETKSYSEDFDAVLVCNGHYAAPSIPDLPGLNEYFLSTSSSSSSSSTTISHPRRIIHSIEYDSPEEFLNQRVLCVGGRASGADIAREISHHAKHVYISDTSVTKSTTISDSDHENKVTLVPKTIGVYPNGTIQLEAEESSDTMEPPEVDTIIFCSGYDYQFPFLNGGIPSENDKDIESDFDFSAVPGERRVSPLFEQLWHAQYPTLAFLGLPHSVVPFPLFELQAEAVVAQWQWQRPVSPTSNNRSNESNDSRLVKTLPPKEERLKAAHSDALRGGPQGTGRVQNTHFLGNAQWDYCRQMVTRAMHKHDDCKNSKTGNSLEETDDLMESQNIKIPDDMEAYLQVNQALYDHAGAARKASPPGGPDDYRKIRYERPTWDEWKVVN